jgi:PAS domain S-box-containing protein
LARVRARSSRAVERSRLPTFDTDLPSALQVDRFLAGVTDQVIALDRDWRYVFVNERVLEVTGLPRERLLGHAIWEVFPEVAGTELERALRRVQAERTPARAEYFDQPLARWFENRAYPTDFGLVNFALDVTDRKHIESLLRRSHDTFFNLLENAPFGIYIVDGQFRLRQLSAGAQKVFSNVRPLIGRDFAEVLRIVWAEPFASEAIARFRHTLATGEPFHAADTTEDRHDIAEVESYDWRIERITLPSGEFGVVCYFYDLTERKRIERALAHARRQLDAALSGGRIATWVWDLAADRVRSDANLTAFYNLPPDDAGGLPVGTYLETLHAADRPRVTALLERAIATGEDYAAEYRIATFDPPRWAYARARTEPGAGGRPVRMAGVVMDITERKRDEQRIAELNADLRGRLEELESLMNVLPIAVFVGHDAACSRITANPAGAAALRIPAGTNASLTAPGADALPFRFRQNGVELPVEALPMHRAARLGRPVTGEEIEIAFADGSVTSHYASATPLFDEAGAVRGCLGVYVDITNRKRAEHALHEADRRKDEFLATLSHELRNPLAPLRNSVYLLRKTVAPDAATRIYAMMERQVDQLVRLVDDLMEVSRISRGTLELRRRRLPLEMALRGAIETADPLIRSGDHRLHLKMPRDPVVIDADPVRIAQVFANLLNNAAKYTDRGGTIALEAWCDGGEAVVTVADTGDGIDVQEMPLLFQMFRRTERSSRRTQGGLGIGLALVQKLVEMHGGTVSAHSEGRGKGSRFTVRLPLAPPAEPEAAAAAGAPAVSRQRVLVVDDNCDAAESLAMLLGHLGVDVRVAHDGLQALAEFEAFRPRVVLLDIGMPGMDGYAVARHLRERCGDTGQPLEIVAVTGWAQDEDKARARAAGFDHHLVKPPDIEALQAVLAATNPVR